MKIGFEKVPPSLQYTNEANTGTIESIRSNLASMIVSVMQGSSTLPLNRHLDNLTNTDRGGMKTFFSGNPPSQIVREKFVQLLHGNGEAQHRALYEELDRYLTVPVSLSLMNVQKRITTGTGTGTGTGTEFTISWSQTSPAYHPTENERVQYNEQVTEQFINDIARSTYIIEFPGDADNKIVLDKWMPAQDKINGILIGSFGENHIKQISEIANQAHMAEFAAVALSMCNNDYIVVAGNNEPQFIIKKHEDGTYPITSSKTFNIKHQINNKMIDGITIEMTRTNILRPESSDKTKLLSGAEEEENGMSFKIRRVKSDTSDIIKTESGFWQKLMGR